MDTHVLVEDAVAIEDERFVATSVANAGRNGDGDKIARALEHTQGDWVFY